VEELMPALWRPTEEGRDMEKVQQVEGEFIHSAVVSGRCVRVGPETARVTIGRQPAPQTPAAPQVEVIREGEIIQAIDVICSCGQRIRVRCTY
jgi:hypothetical protein